MTLKKITQAEQRRRSKHAEFLYTAGHTLIEEWNTPAWLAKIKEEEEKS